ncbi:MAG: ABC transporter permease [Ruminococcus flavefaciens]|nr:ABC transporter permease [Ruminococcus flavefaciens]
MKSKKKMTLTRILKMLIIIIFFAGALISAVYPVGIQDVTLKVDTNAGTFSKTIYADEIESANAVTINFENAPNTKIREIRIYRKLKTMCLEKIQSANVTDFATANGQGITLNADACSILKEVAGSSLMERLLCMEVLLALCIFLWIMIDALEEKMNPSSIGNHGPIFNIRRFFRDLMKYKEYAFYAAKADLKAEVANSYLNRLWWLLEPFLRMMVYVFVFGRVMGRSVQNYSTFVYSALLMFSYFSKTINYSVKCVRSSREIVSKVYIPKYILLISDMILNFYKLVFSMLVLVIMMFVFRVQIGWNIFFVVPAYMVMILFSFGVGMICLHFGVYVDDLSYAVGILMQMLMFLSGEFYDVITSLSVPLNIMMICLNPAAMFIDTMRNALLYNVAANLPLVGIWTIISILLCYIGIHTVYKNENGYVKVI